TRLTAPGDMDVVTRTTSAGGGGTSRSTVRGLDRTIPIGEAARALGESLDTLRRWERTGRLQTSRDERNRRVIPESEITRLGGRAVCQTRTAVPAPHPLGRV